MALLAGGCVMGDAFETVLGEVRDEAGSPIPGAKVALVGAPGTSYAEVQNDSTTDEKGHFFTQVCYGTGWGSGFVLRVEKKGFETIERRVTEADERGSIIVMRRSR
jgi:hypothetical protein